MRYIIEHLDKRLYAWSLLEYNHISKVVGRDNLVFTNVRSAKERKKLSQLGRCFAEKIEEMQPGQIADIKGLGRADTAQKAGTKSQKVDAKSASEKPLCVLDPDSEAPLTYSDKDEFSGFIFGGILGDYPMKKRTKKELTSRLKLPARNMGKKQMSTNTAVMVAHLILSGKKFEDIRFKDKIELDIRPGESIILPYRYVIEGGKPVLPEGFIGFLKRRKGF
jgi:ribosome biogenesis SPOUT family RNA methylase Rps3